MLPDKILFAKPCTVDIAYLMIHICCFLGEDLLSVLIFVLNKERYFDGLYFAYKIYDIRTPYVQFTIFCDRHAQCLCYFSIDREPLL